MKINRRVVKKILIGLLIIFFLMQFVRPARNSGKEYTATDITHLVHVPDTVLHILKVSCYDCHSNHTEYPWYTNIQPLGFWLASHINDGKEDINFSDVSGLDKKKLDRKFKEISDQVESGNMPLSSYTFIHRYARLDSGQISMIKSWTDSAKREIGYQP